MNFRGRKDPPRPHRPWPVYPRFSGTMLTTTPKRNPASKSNKSDAVVDRLRATRTPGESYSDVILRIAGEEAGR